MDQNQEHTHKNACAAALPLLRYILTPFAASTPALIALNACSSGTGVGTHLKAHK